jgi:hypothetical protein
MRPVALEYERDRFVVVHECTGCGVRRRNRAHRDDNLSPLVGG